MVEVVAALIRKKERFLICQRPANKACPLLWEFPGGKVEKDESKKQALIRECLEELGITLEVGELYMEVKHQYPDFDIRLSLFEAVIKTGEVIKNEHHALAWIKSEEILQYEFCPADAGIVKKIIGHG